MIKKIVKDFVGSVLRLGFHLYIPIFLGETKYRKYQKQLKEKFTSDLPIEYKMINGVVATALHGLFLGLSTILTPYLFIGVITLTCIDVFFVFTMEHKETM